MGPKKVHIDFQWNGYSFTSVDELLIFAKDSSEEIYLFLKDWFSDTAVIWVSTSGSTGVPKKISLEKSKMIQSALATGAYFNLPNRTKALLCLPVAYIAGKMMLVRAITLGWCLDVVSSSAYPLKDPQKKYDFSAMVPLQLENSIEHLKSIKKLIVGGGAVSAQLQQKLQGITTEVYATYGMTETITHIAVKRVNNTISLWNKITNSYFSKTSNTQVFYQTLPNTTIYIDQRNCLVIKNDTISKEVIFTNDVVQLISETQFNWLGRFDNVINSGGIKLHPEKIEEKLGSVIKKRFFVAGIPDTKFGEKLILVVEGTTEPLPLENVGLSKFEKPKEIYFVKEFIETETQKIQRTKTLNLISF